MKDQEAIIHPLVVRDIALYPGQSKIVDLAVGELPSGTNIAIKAHVFRALKPGPAILLLGGVHGDEINGIEILRQSLASAIFEQLLAGTVIVIPLLNVYGFINLSRDMPDGRDVNRAFPGLASGSLASRVAHALSKEILPLVDFGIDFHTGGGGIYNYPQLRYNPEDEKSKEIAAAFGAPLMIASKAPVKSLRKTAQKLQIPILTFEGGENQRYDGFSLQVGYEGIQRLLLHFGMLSNNHTLLEPAVKSKEIYKSSWLRAHQAGLFRWFKSSGHQIRKGEPLGVICDPHGNAKDKRLLAPKDGYLIGHVNSAVVNQGDALFHIGELEEE